MGGGAARGASIDGLLTGGCCEGGGGGTALVAFGIGGGSAAAGKEGEWIDLSSASVLSSKLESRKCDFKASLCLTPDAMSVS